MENDDQQSIVWDVELGNRHKFYETTASSENGEYYHVLSSRIRDLIVSSAEFSGRTWLGGFVPLRETLLRLIAHCPIEFSASETGARGRGQTMAGDRG
jgi:hypothetical protein